MTLLSLWDWLIPLQRQAAVCRLQRRDDRTLRRVVPRLEALEDRTLPSTYTVLNLHDSGLGSLRQAVLDADAHPGDNTIRFADGLHGTITLTSGELDISGDLTIHGPGANRITVSGNHASRIFDISSGATVIIAGVTIAHGRATQGAGIDNAGTTLTVSHCILSDNQAVGVLGGDGLGGGIDNEPGVPSRSSPRLSTTIGPSAVTPPPPVRRGMAREARFYSGANATVSDSTFIDNEAIGGNAAGGLAGKGEGGGIGNRGTLTVSHSTFEGNQALGGAGLSATISGDNGVGGGLMSIGSASTPASTSVDHSTFSDNQAEGGTGGAAATGGTGAGGGIFTDTGTFLLSHSKLRENQALGGAGGSGGRGRGGAFAAGSQNGNTSVVVSHSALSANQAVGGAAGVGGTAGIGSGGGISNQVNVPGHTADLTVDQCILVGNQALGGTGNTGGSGRGGAIENVLGATLTVNHSTLTSNQAVGGDGLHGGDGLGGGAYNDALSNLTFQRSTIVNNDATGGTAGTSGSDGQGVGGGLYVAPGGTVDADHTKIKHNHASTSDDDVFGSLS